MGFNNAHSIFRSSMHFLPEEFQPDVLFGGAIPGFGVIVTLVVVFLQGLLLIIFLGKKLFLFTNIF